MQGKGIRPAVVLVAVATASFFAGSLARAQHDPDDYDQEKEIRKFDADTKKTFDDLLEVNKKAHEIVETLKKGHMTWDDAIAKYHQVADGVEKMKASDKFKKNNRVNPYYNAACAASLAAKEATERKDEKEAAAKKAAALKDLAKSIEIGWHDFKHMEEDKDLDAIRNEPEYKAILDKAKGQANEASAKQREKLAAETKSLLKKPPLFELFDFEIKSVDGQPLKLADMKGKVVCINIWGTWSDDSRELLANIEKLHQTMKDKGLFVLGFADEGTVEDAEAGIAKRAANFDGKNSALHYPQAFLERGGRIYESIPDLSPRDLPVTLFLDKEGKVKIRRNGKFQKYEDLETIAQTMLDNK